MNTKDEIKSKKKIAAVDILIIILILLRLGGIVLRIMAGEGGVFAGDGKGEYTVSFTVNGQPDEYSSYFSEGTEFAFEGGEPFGAVAGNATFTPAELHSENSRGEYVHGYASDGTVDIKGTMTVKGTMTDSGFLINSNTYIAPNMTVTVSSPDITVTLTVTDITKAD